MDCRIEKKKRIEWIHTLWGSHQYSRERAETTTACTGVCESHNMEQQGPDAKVDMLCDSTQRESEKEQNPSS